MTYSSLFLPTSAEWNELLALNRPAELEDYMESTLLHPVRSFLEVPGKNIRAKLVEVGFHLSTNDLASLNYKLDVASAIIEYIHAGALIVDDIQDGSEVRRNAPTLHLEHGLPKALNAGNWLYFWALAQLPKLNLSPHVSQNIMNDCLNIMVRAHFGQALDVGTAIDEVPQARVKDIVMAAMELKTGTLLALALKLGAAVGEGQIELQKKLATLGTRLGVALQMFDDIGNFFQVKKDGPTKRHEDLKLKRPTFVWVGAAAYSQDSYTQFKRAVNDLPAEESLLNWTTRHDFRKYLLNEAQVYLNHAVEDFKSEWGKSHPQSMQIIFDLAQQLEKAYV